MKEHVILIKNPGYSVGTRSKITEGGRESIRGAERRELARCLGETLIISTKRSAN